MRAVTIEKEYKAGDIFNIFLCSDPHLEDPDHDRRLFIKEMEYAKKKNADILIGGDIFGSILPTDNKRYTASRTKYQDTDDLIGMALEEAVNVFTPYAKNIKVILCGNHDDSVIKHHHVDIVALLIYELNKLEGVNIEYLGYQGFIRYSYRYANGKRSMHYDIKATHGSGGGSVVTRGTIGINRQMNSAIADLYFSGHTHTKVILPDENCSYLDQYGNIKRKSRKGVITGAYLYPVREEKTRRGDRPNSYSVDYGDKMKSLQSTGGVMMSHEFTTVEEFEVRLTC